jgi:hypothetical protein
MIGSEISIEVRSDSADEVVEHLVAAGLWSRVRPQAEANSNETAAPMTRVRVNHLFPCEVTLLRAGAPLQLERPGTDGGEVRLDRDELRARIDQARHAAEAAIEADDASEDGYHPDTLAMLRVLLARLEEVALDPARHPEGDALYHSLQVYELGRLERPYDEEFLLACLLHDVGLGIDRRDPVPAALSVLQGLLTERTCFLIEHRAEAREYLKTGKLPRSLRRSEHFDDLVLLAQCDLGGRVRGAEVSGVDEALEYVANLESAWDDV